MSGKSVPMQLGERQEQQHQQQLQQQIHGSMDPWIHIHIDVVNII